MLFSFSWLAAIKNSPHVIQGAVSTGHQYHFHMETQVTDELFSALYFSAKRVYEWPLVVLPVPFLQSWDFILFKISF